MCSTKRWTGRTTRARRRLGFWTSKSGWVVSPRMRPSRGRDRPFSANHARAPASEASWADIFRGDEVGKGAVLVTLSGQQQQAALAQETRLAIFRLLVEHAVRGMIPHNKLGRAVYRKLKVYAGPNHPHTAQQPQPLDI